MNIDPPSKAMTQSMSMTNSSDVCLPLLSVSWESYWECFERNYVRNLRTSDQVLGSVIIFCSVMGLLGNISAFCYFCTSIFHCNFPLQLKIIILLFIKNFKYFCKMRKQRNNIIERSVILL